jgi:hypothetical protein
MLQQLVEVRARHVEPVGAEATLDPLEVALVLREPDATEAAHVPVAELAVVELEHEAIVRMILPRPGQVAGHAEGQDEGRTLGQAQK